MRVTADVVFLLDVDNTLLDNDRIIVDLRRHLEREFGVDSADRYWAIFEGLRGELGYADYLGALQRYRSDAEQGGPDDQPLLLMSSFLVDYPFAERLFPRALEVVDYLGRFGPTVILSDGDVVFQPRKLQRSGIDALVIEGSEAGGHIGAVSTAVLAQEILPAVREVPIFVAGGIGRGEAVLAYLEMGASGVQLGTRFVCATESIAHPRFKRAFLRAAARDAVPSPQLDPRFPVIPVRALANAGTARFVAFQREVIQRFDDGELSREQALLQIERYWAGALRRAVIEGDVENGSLMAGQSVALVTREQPTREIIEELLDQAIARMQGRDAASPPVRRAAE